MRLALSYDIIPTDHTNNRSYHIPHCPALNGPSAANMSISPDIASPFEVGADPISALEHDSIFQSVRQRMERKNRSAGSTSFCSFHSAECSEHQLSVFQLHRDIICALLLPLFEIHNQADRKSVV